MFAGVFKELAFKFLLRLVHLFFALYQLIVGGWSALKGFFRRPDFDKGELRERLRSLTKIPQHLAVILGAESPNYQALANLIAWSIASGIPFISFYDYTGLLKKNEDRLVKVVTQQTGLNYEDGELNNGCQNGMSRRIRMRVFAGDDGQQCIVKLTKNLSRDVKSGIINIDFIDMCMRDILGNMPDPELAIICGKMCCTFGFLPWQVRVTEFVTVETLCGFTLDKFLSTLDFYDKREQRFGK